ncbi:hypothetical protein DICVIV_12706 [Dictyocaulus viviparus]|uniref:Nucleolar GTP-binding protein 2 n=1 Tax=Dictyocaulus viviparus TaxID=29172 RepID=A0A0D8XC35_DICVI|nr:hypothetical protein DICVIV_12706 [Dictyocaulus viviparus]
MSKKRNEEKSVKVKRKPNHKMIKNKHTFKGSNHSLNPDRPKDAKSSHLRSKATINRLRMYKSFKAIRDKNGRVLKAAPFQDWLKSGTVARVEPNRKWFGNTRIVGQDQLQKFQENLGKVLKDPFQVVMKQTKLPISLLQEKTKQRRVHVLDTESFEYAFGKKAQRKKPRLSCGTLEEIVTFVDKREQTYSASRDRDLQLDERDLVREENPNPLFRAGQSNRVWGELYKVLDSSDVVVEVIDARDPMGTRCHHVEDFLRKEKPYKHLVIVINKVDLVPTWVTRKWIGEFSKILPTIAFHASIQHSFGKGSLINLLRQYAKLHKDKQQENSRMIKSEFRSKYEHFFNNVEKCCKCYPFIGTDIFNYIVNAHCCKFNEIISH